MKHADKGFSLIEVLVAMSLFMIVATAVSSLMYHSTSHLSGSNHLSQAIACAQETLEGIRVLAYEDMDNASSECVGDGMSFDVVSEITENDPDDGMKTVVVTVSWNEKGESKSYAIQTIYTKITA